VRVLGRVGGGAEILEDGAAAEGEGGEGGGSGTGGEPEGAE
jgi:hypothetical protein